MKLAKEEADLFFKLMWGLQFYINEQRQILPKVKSVEEYTKLQSADKVQVRDVLWENPGLIDAYVAENSDGLSAAELGIVRKWKGFVSGTFQIFRLLKKHAVFIREDSQVYGVLGLHDSLEEVFLGRPLPIMVQAVLLPFKGKVVYDGLLKWSNIFFGGGIRTSLKEEYMVAKQQGRIITTLEPELAEPARSVRKGPDKDWGVEVDGLVKATEEMKGGSMVQNSAFALQRASARLTQAAIHHPDDFAGLWRLERQVRMALTRLQTTLERAER